MQTLAHNSTATLSVIKDYLVNKLQKQSCQIEQDNLMHHVPKETTELLKNLCTDYQPTGDSEGLGFMEGKKANSEEFIPVFANNSRELKAFLEHMTEVQSDSPQGVYDTLLELRLQNWAHELDEQIKEKCTIESTQLS